MIILENAQLKATISEHGAELVSVIDKDLDRECIWVADPAVWDRHAPLLFPFIGNIRNKEYRFQGKTYAMKTQHGFARDYDFAEEKTAENQAVFTLEATDAMKEIYPFDWTLKLVYTLNGKSLKIEHFVINKDQENPMYFSLGGHPGFMFEGPLEEQQFEFNSDEDLDRMELNLSVGLFSHEITKDFVKGGAPITITPHVFDKDAMVFHNFKFTEVTMVNKSTRHGVTMDLTGFPYVGLWAKPGAPYACIEPWYGHADYDDFDGDLTEKAGIETLEKGGTFTAVYTVTFF